MLACHGLELFHRIKNVTLGVFTLDAVTVAGVVALVAVLIVFTWRLSR